MSNIKNNNYPTVWVYIFGLLVFFHAMIIIISLATHKINNQSLFILIWHIIIGAGYISMLVYTYKKRKTLSRGKINFLIFAGFILYIFLSFSGCFLMVPIH